MWVIPILFLFNTGSGWNVRSVRGLWDFILDEDDLIKDCPNRDNRRALFAAHVDEEELVDVMELTFCIEGPFSSLSFPISVSLISGCFDGEYPVYNSLEISPGKSSFNMEVVKLSALCIFFSFT